MSRFIESICIIDGKIRQPGLHQHRMNRSRYKILGITEAIDLEENIFSNLAPQIGKYKCRIVYGAEIESVEFIPYQIRPIKSIRLVENNAIEYPYKYSDRKAFELLSDNIAEDEILVVRNGQITDTSFSNIVFFDGKKKVTPRGFLLNGTMRQSLLESGKITEDAIGPADLKRFHSFQLINAMMDLEESPELDISVIG
ncbi:MAG: aminotransferase class IV [Moheibacter sp.]